MKRNSLTHGFGVLSYNTTNPVVQEAERHALACAMAEQDKANERAMLGTYSNTTDLSGEVPGRLNLDSFRAAKAALLPPAWYGVSEHVDTGKIFIITKSAGPVPYPDIFVVHPDTLPELERHAAENKILLRPVSEWRLGMCWLALQS